MGRRGAHAEDLSDKGVEVHPFYGPSGRLLGEPEGRATGLLSMAAYLAFWAGAIVLAKRELDARFPRGGGQPGRVDPAMALARQRYARGEIDRDTYQRIARDLSGPVSGS